MSIINQIISKFSQDYCAPGPGALAAGFALPLAVSPLPLALAADKQKAFWRRYNNAADKVFRELMDETYCYSESVFFDFLLNTPELKEFLREDLQSAEVILIDLNKASALSLKQVERALSEAKDAEEFKKLVLEERAAKANIWFELENNLKVLSL